MSEVCAAQTDPPLRLIEVVDAEELKNYIQLRNEALERARSELINRRLRFVGKTAL